MHVRENAMQEKREKVEMRRGARGWLQGGDFGSGPRTYEGVLCHSIAGATGKRVPVKIQHAFACTGLSQYFSGRNYKP